jgi:hypothetical protein
MRIVLAAVCTAIVAAAALPAQAQSMQTPQPGPNSPPLTCADYKHNSDGSWAPAHEVSVLFPDGTTLSVSPSVTFPANESYMGLPMAALLDQKCGAK